jgi:hypothetical protein
MNFLLFVAVVFAWHPGKGKGEAGYRIHWGTAQGAPDNHRDLGNVTTAAIENAKMPKSTIVYFTRTSYNAKGLESAPSNEVAFMLEPAPTSALTAVPVPRPVPNLARFDVVSGGIHLYPGTVVKISADDPPAGKILERWTGDAEILSNLLITPTTAIMPTIDVEVAAQYADIPGITISPPSLSIMGKVGIRPPPLTVTISTSNGRRWKSFHVSPWYDAGPISGASGSSEKLTPSIGWHSLAVGTHKWPMTFSAPGLPSLTVEVQAIVQP